MAPPIPREIHGLRVYPQSIEVVQGVGAPILVHGSVSDECSDFFYIFRPLAAVLRGHVVANDCPVSYTDDGTLEDPMPELREQFGASVLSVDVKSHMMLLRGDDFERWGASLRFCEGAFLPIFRRPPTTDLLKHLGRYDLRLTAETWPEEMRAFLHMWDDIYWQLFSTERSDVDVLIRAHVGDPKLKMYFVDLELEYPLPSNQPLRPATPSAES
jgi:hypothetical protein